METKADFFNRIGSSLPIMATKRVGQIECKQVAAECNVALSSVEEIDCFFYAQSWYCKSRD